MMHRLGAMVLALITGMGVVATLMPTQTSAWATPADHSAGTVRQKESGSVRASVVFPSGRAVVNPAASRAARRVVAAIPPGAPAVITVSAAVRRGANTASARRLANERAVAVAITVRRSPAFDPTSMRVRVIGIRVVPNAAAARTVQVIARWNTGGVAAATAPTVPRDVQAVGAYRSILVAWKPPRDPGTIGTLTYRAYAISGRARPPRWTPSSTTPFCTVVDALTCSITGVTTGAGYTVAVIASNEVGDSPPSDWPYGPVVPYDPTSGDNAGGSSSTQVPGRPGTPTLTAANQEMAASWSAPTDGGAVSGYRVYVATSSSGPFSDANGTCSPAVTTTSTAVTCTVGNLNNGVAYYVRVAGVNAAGTGDASNVSAPATPLGVPGTPTAPTATAGNTTATVVWTAPTAGGTAITGYEVQSSQFNGAFTSQPGCSSLGVVLTCTATGLINGTSTRFRVAAVNGAGQGPWSPASTAITPRGVPDAPQQPQAIAGVTSVAVFWDPPYDNGAAITGYTVTQATSSGGVYSDVTSSCAEASSFPKATSCTLTSLTGGQEYFYKVSATNAAGSGSASPASLGVVPISPSSAPVIQAITPGNTQLAIDYTVTASGGETVWSRYSSNDGATYSAWANSTSTSGSLTITGLTNGTTYEVQLGLGTADPPTYLSGTGTGRPATTPGAPTGVSGTSQDSSVLVTWTAPGTTGGAAIDGYLVEIATSITGPWTAPGGTCDPDLTTATSSTTCQATGLTNGTTYFFRVAARNDVGYGSTASSAGITPAGPPAAPAAPTGLGEVNQIVVTWAAPSTNGAAITGYVLQRATSALGPYAAIGTGTCSSTSSSTATSCVDNDGSLVSGADYFYRVAANSSAGSSEFSDDSGAVSPTSDASAPDITLITPGNGSLSVAFTYGPAATNLQYTTNGGTSWTTRSPASVTSPLTITGLANGTTYEVQIRMVTAGGLSPESSSATGTPRTTPTAPAAPTGTAGNTSVTLSWTAPADDGGTEITGYTVQSSTNGTTYADQAGCTTLGVVYTCVATGLASGTAVTFKVAAVNAAGTGSYSAASAAITPVAATCAAGGTCQVGDTGPGGGTVFYVGSFTLTSTGQTMSYLEVAGATWTDTRVAWSGNTSSSVSTSEALGSGAANTAAIIAQSNTAGRAATNAAAYNGGGLTDWFLPSYQELAALQGSGQGGPYNSPGYWSSSQYNSTNAFTRVMSNNSTPYMLKGSTRWVRPIRAFG